MQNAQTQQGRAELTEITPLNRLPESRPRVPERPCSACGTRVDPLRAACVLAFDDGFAFLCGPECEAAFRSGARFTAVRSGRARRDATQPAPEARETAGHAADEAPQRETEPYSRRRWIALGASAVALGLASFSYIPAAAWAADALSFGAAALTLGALGPQARDRDRFAFYLGPAAVLLAVIANRWMALRGLTPGSASLQAAIGSSLVVARLWLVELAQRPVEAAIQRLRVQVSHAPLPTGGHNAPFLAVAQAEHGRRVQRAARFGDGSERESGRTSLLAQRWSHLSPWVSLGAAVVVCALVPGPVHARLTAAAAILLVAPTLLPRGLRSALRAAGTSAAARGVFFRSEVGLELCARSKTAVLSPRGLLTEAQPIVVELRQLDREFSADALVAMAAAVEHAAAEHPLARAVQRFARERRAPEIEVRRPLHHLHRGVSGVSTHGQPIVVGSRRLMMEQGISVAVADSELARAEASEHTAVFIALDDRVRAMLTLHHELHPEARPALQRLVDLGMQVIVLTGDQLGTVRTLAAGLDIDNVRAELTPEERGHEVRKLRGAGERVAAIGCAGEDDPVLLAADAAVALGSGGRVAESFAVLVPDGHLREAAAALGMARAVQEQCLRSVWSVAATFVLLCVAAVTGLLGPGLAALACLPAEVYALSAGARLLRRFALMLPARD